MPADTRSVDSGALTWYINWLSELYPDWTEEQRFEIATGFVAAQLPPARLVEEDDPVEEARKEERKMRRYLTGEELLEILQTPGTIPKVSGN
jgi:hypothetical protein